MGGRGVSEGHWTSKQRRSSAKLNSTVVRKRLERNAQKVGETNPLANNWSHRRVLPTQSNGQKKGYKSKKKGGGPDATDREAERIMGAPNGEGGK